MAKKRPYSLNYTAQRNPRRYLLSGIPPTLWEAVRRQAKKEGIAMRFLILLLLDAWLAHSVNRERGREIVPSMRKIVQLQRQAAPESAASRPPGKPH